MFEKKISQRNVENKMKQKRIYIHIYVFFRCLLHSSYYFHMHVIWMNWNSRLCWSTKWKKNKKKKRETEWFLRSEVKSHLAHGSSFHIHTFCHRSLFRYIFGWFISNIHFEIHPKKQIFSQQQPLERFIEKKQSTQTYLNFCINEDEHKNCMACVFWKRERGRESTKTQRTGKRICIALA